jgi:hypothetical protein
MSDTELEHLRKMANQISANFTFYDDQVARITDHITRFWAPSMRKLFSDYVEQGGQGVDDAVRAAMKDVRVPASSET